MDKKELYDMLASLEQTSCENPNFWQAVAYLSYCNTQILNHADEEFNSRLVTLIDRANEESSLSCNCKQEVRDSFPYNRVDFIPYAISPEGNRDRYLETEFFPAALRVTLKI